MELTIYLSKVFGVALIVMGAATLARRRYFVPVFGTFAAERLLRAIVGFMEMLAALFLLFAHNMWSPLPAAIVTLFGWVALIESITYLLLPDESVDGLLRVINKPAWYVGGGLVSILVGIYLAGFGFGWW
jgi:hypothetical protein